MTNNPFLKRLMKAKMEDVAHSSAYAKAQNPGVMGSASAESFGARMMMEQNRKNVRGYGDSRVVSDMRAGAPRAKTFEGAAGAGGTNTKPVTPPIRKNPGISR